VFWRELKFNLCCNNILKIKNILIININLPIIFDKCWINWYKSSRQLCMLSNNMEQGRFYHPASLGTRPGSVADLVGDLAATKLPIIIILSIINCMLHQWCSGLGRGFDPWYLLFLFSIVLIIFLFKQKMVLFGLEPLFPMLESTKLITAPSSPQFC
jgi:hypothetical protein